MYLLFIWNMFCCRLACHDTLEVPQYHRGGGGSVFVVYLEHVLLSTCLPRHSRSTTVPQGEAGVVYLLFIWNMFCCRLACHDTLEVLQYHRGGGGVVTLPPSRGGGGPMDQQLCTIYINSDGFKCCLNVFKFPLFLLLANIFRLQRPISAPNGATGHGTIET